MPCVVSASTIKFICKWKNYVFSLTTLTVTSYLFDFSPEIEFFSCILPLPSLFPVHAEQALLFRCALELFQFLTDHIQIPE